MDNRIGFTGSILLLAVSNLSAATLYVSLGSTNATPPYAAWATAAANIRDAVDASNDGDTVLVTNGAYAGGLEVNKPLTLRSVNGPQFTVINGGGTNRCASLTNGASLSGITLTNGWAAISGGGVWCASQTALLINCVITGKSGYCGGGAVGGTLFNCALTGNSAQYGGGAYGCTLYNCTLTGNSADYGAGGGAYGCTLYNCTLTGNSAEDGGGAGFCTLYNCIVYFNTASDRGANYDTDGYSTLDFCCTMPLPTNGVGNVALDPQLASTSHLSTTSPCRGAGSAAHATGTDIDGEPWDNPPSIGCDEYHPGAVTGPLTVNLLANYTNVAVGYAVSLTALVEGRSTESRWDLGDGVVVSNRPYASRGWAMPGDYALVLHAYNESQPEGVTATLTIHVVAQPVLHVATTSTHPQPPYASWATAATNIQDAVDAAVLPGTLVLVTNGVYPGGLAVTNPLMLMSVNGPQFTVINGGGTNRCATLSEGASLSGFRLTGGGVLGGDGGGVWCASTNAFLTNCVIEGNWVSSFWFSGGGGGGAYRGTLYNCTLTGNGAWDGGGASGSTLYNCTLTGNGALGGGGGVVSESTLYNCTLSANDDVGAWNSTLYNCTLTGNSGGGAWGGTLYNCIVYFNTAAQGANYDTSCTLNYCCTTPLPTNGVGNIALDPQLASASHLGADSPCRGAGSAAYATGTDIDGDPWGNPPAIGCDEYYAGSVTGPLVVKWLADYTVVTPGYAVTFTALIEGRTTDSVWVFGDGDVAINQPYVTHSWTQPGDYLVALWAFNESHPEGVSATGMVRVAVQPVVYVAAGSITPLPPYLSWATAATNIQQAVDVAGPGAEILVTNGVYTGGVAVTNPLALRSVNGPQFTVIDGGGTVRCASLTDGASLTGFTLTNGWAADAGGGVRCTSTKVFLTNCMIVGNSAWYGGGVYSGTLCNCTLTGNIAVGGGGAYFGTLYNCTLTANSAFGVDTTRGEGGGGAFYSTLYNCIVYFNTAPKDANYEVDSTLNYSCTTPLPYIGVGNVTNVPLFVDYTNGNLRLQSTSPCINSGNNAYVTTATDLDGRPRIVGGAVDMGAYELQPGLSGAFVGWLTQYGLPADGSADFIDSDGDGLNNWQEWVCGTNPTNALSVLKMLAPSPALSGVSVSWQSVAGISYTLERSTALAAQPGFSILQSNLVGQPLTTTYTDTNALGPGPFFYRVGVKAP